VNTKQHIFKPSGDIACHRFAISTAHRIWKVCWQTNMLLNIKLALPAPILRGGVAGVKDLDSTPELDTSPEDLVYEFIQDWKTFRLMSARTAGITRVKGFQYIFEVESDKAEGLPDPEELLLKLKKGQYFSAVIRL